MSTAELPSRVYPIEPVSKMARRTALVVGAFLMLIALSAVLHFVTGLFLFLDGK